MTGDPVESADRPLPTDDLADVVPAAADAPDGEASAGAPAPDATEAAVPQEEHVWTVDDGVAVTLAVDAQDADAQDSDGTAASDSDPVGPEPGSPVSDVALPAEPEPDADADADAEPEARPEPEPEAGSGAAEPNEAGDADAGSPVEDPVPSAVQEADPEPDPEPAPELDPEPDPAPGPDPRLQAEEPASAPQTPPVAARPTGWAAVTAAFRPHPATRGQTLAGVLCAVLGFALVVQVHQVNTSGLSALRQADLVQVLARVTGESARLEEEAAGLQQARERLADGDVDRASARESARQRLQVLAILAGTAPAQGPGLTVAVTDPKGRVGAAEILDAVQELRDAGAEAMQIDGGGGSVRIVAGTSFVDEDGGLRTGGELLKAPFTLRVLGDPDTLAAALTIPGGVDDVLRGLGSEVTVTPQRDLVVTALAPQVQYRYARPTG